MTRSDFFAALHTAVPGSTPETVQKWIDFAVECVGEEQYANFTPSTDPEANVENWLETLCGGVYAVRAEYGGELAGKLVNLGLDNCCLYPGEMLQAAECLRDGGTAETISAKIASDEIESEQPFFPVPVHPLTERDCGPDKAQFGTKAKMLTPDEAETLIGHAVGGVCPFGINDGVTVYLDNSLKRFETVFPACGSSNSAIELSIEELEKYSGCAAWIDVCKEWRE